MIAEKLFAVLKKESNTNKYTGSNVFMLLSRNKHGNVFCQI